MTETTITIELDKDRAGLLIAALGTWYSESFDLTDEEFELYESLLEEVTEANDELEEREGFSDEFIEAVNEMLEEDVKRLWARMQQVQE